MAKVIIRSEVNALVAGTFTDDLNKAVLYGEVSGNAAFVVSAINSVSNIAYTAEQALLDVDIDVSSGRYLSISPSTASISSTGTQQYTVTLHVIVGGVETETQDVTTLATYTSSNANVTVNATGLATANNNTTSALSVTITASYDGLSTTASLSVAGGAVTYRNLHFQPKYMTGSTALDTSDVADGRHFNVFVDEYVNETRVQTWGVDSVVTLTVSDSNALTVTSSVSGCYAHPIYNSSQYYPSTRSVTVTARYQRAAPATDLTATMPIEILPEGRVEQFLEITPTTATISASGSQQLTVKLVTLTDGVRTDEQNVTSTATYSSSNPNITVNGSGLVTANNQSSSSITANITASYTGVASVVSVITAEAAGAASISIIYNGGTIPASGAASSNFTITASNATVSGYSVNNSATVSNTGATTVTVTFPANTSTASTVTYTVEVHGYDQFNNHVSGTCQVSQAKAAIPNGTLVVCASTAWHLTSDSGSCWFDVIWTNLKSGTTITLTDTALTSYSPTSISITSSNWSGGTVRVTADYDENTGLSSRNLVLHASATEVNNGAVSGQDYYEQSGVIPAASLDVDPDGTSTPYSAGTVNFTVSWDNIKTGTTITLTSDYTISPSSISITASNYQNGSATVTLTKTRNTGNPRRVELVAVGYAMDDSLINDSGYYMQAAQPGTVSVSAGSDWHLDSTSGSNAFTVSWTNLATGTTIVLTKENITSISPTSINVTTLSGSATVNFDYTALSGSSTRNLKLTATGTDRNGNSKQDSDYFTQHGPSNSALAVTAVTSSPVAYTTTSVTFNVSWVNIYGTISVSSNIGSVSTSSISASGTSDQNITVSGFGQNTGSSDRTITLYASTTFNNKSDNASIVQQHHEAVITYDNIKFNTSVGSGSVSSLSLDASETSSYYYAVEDKNIDGVFDSYYNDTASASYKLYTGTTANNCNTLVGSFSYSTGSMYSDSYLTISGSGSGTSAKMTFASDNSTTSAKYYRITATDDGETAEMRISIAAYTPSYSPDIWWTKTNGGSSSTSVSSVSDVSAYVSGTYDGRDVEYTIYINYNSDVSTVSMDTSGLRNGASASRSGKTVTITAPANSGSSRSLGSIVITGTAPDGTTYDSETLSITQVSGSGAASGAFLTIENVTAYTDSVNIPASGGTRSYDVDYSYMGDIGVSGYTTATGATLNSSITTLTVGFGQNSASTTKSWGAIITGHTVFGTVKQASVMGTQSAAPSYNPYIRIEGDATHYATGTTHILDQSKSFTFSISHNDIDISTLGTASTQSHTSEHNHMYGASVTSAALYIYVDGRTLTSIGTGYVTDYIDVSGTSLGGGTVRATLVIRIELEKVTIGWHFSNSGIPTVPANTSYELLVDGSSVTYPGASRAYVTYVRYSTHSVSFSANVGDTSSFPSQTITANTLADNGSVNPNEFPMVITLTNYGPYTSTTQNVRMDDSGDANVSFNWQQTYIFSLTTTQAGCTVVMCGVTQTSSSQANHTYTIASVNSSISYSVSKTGYYTESGTIYSSSPSISVTLVEITSTYEDVRTDGPTQLYIVNNSNQILNLNIVTMELYGMTSNGRTTLGTWTTGGLEIAANGNITVSFPGYGLGTKQVSTNTSPEIEVNINQFNGSAYYATVQYPEWQSGHYGNMSDSLSGEDYNLSGSMPTLTRAPGSTYVFPHDRIQITFS